MKYAIDYNTENDTFDALEQLISLLVLKTELDDDEYNFATDVYNYYYADVEDDYLCEMIERVWNAETANDMLRDVRRLKEVIDSDRRINAKYKNIGTFGYDDETGDCTFTMEWRPNLKLV